VTEDCLKLTCYFGERSRGPGGFVADSLLDLFGAHDIATSVLLRGIEGFGRRHRLRTDQSLTLSEDPPIAAIAVDSRSRMEALLPAVGQLAPPGLLTLERARMLTTQLSDIELPEQLHEATRLTIYVGRQDKVAGVPAFLAVCELLHARGLAGASVFLGVDGTAHGTRSRARFFSSNSDVPVMVLSVGSGEAISRVLPELGTLLRRPLVTLERVRVCKRDGKLLARPHELPNTDSCGRDLWQKLMVYTSESTSSDGRPIHRDLMYRLRKDGVAHGATALRGLWGFHGEHPPGGDKVLQVGRRVPVTSIVVDRPDRIAAIFDTVDALTREHGLVTTEMVPAAVSTHDGVPRGVLRLADHDF
jgi:PII-like signaling protein